MAEEQDELKVSSHRLYRMEIEVLPPRTLRLSVSAAVPQCLLVSCSLCLPPSRFVPPLIPLVPSAHVAFLLPHTRARRTHTARRHGLGIRCCLRRKPPLAVCLLPACRLAGCGDGCLGCCAADCRRGALACAHRPPFVHTHLFVRIVLRARGAHPHDDDDDEPRHASSVHSFCGVSGCGSTVPQPIRTHSCLDSFWRVGSWH